MDIANGKRTYAEVVEDPEKQKNVGKDIHVPVEHIVKKLIKVWYVSVKLDIPILKGNVLEKPEMNVEQNIPVPVEHIVEKLIKLWHVSVKKDLSILKGNALRKLQAVRQQEETIAYSHSLTMLMESDMMGVLGLVLESLGALQWQIEKA